MHSKTRYQNSIDTYLLLTKPCKMKHQFLTWQQFISYLKMPVVYGSRAAPRCRTSILVQEVTINILASSLDGLWLNSEGKGLPRSRTRTCYDVHYRLYRGFTGRSQGEARNREHLVSPHTVKFLWNFFDVLDQLWKFIFVMLIPPSTNVYDT